MTKKTAKKKAASKKVAKKTSKKKVVKRAQAPKRDTVVVPVSVMEEEGSHAIDHSTILDDHEMPDTNKYPAEDLVKLESADLSFWNNSWTWVEAANSYGDKPEDKWFINPTAKLIGEVMHNAPTIFSACEVGLVAGEHTTQFAAEKDRHAEFLQWAPAGDLVSEALDMMTAYQGRYFEAVQRYLGQQASYNNQRDNQNATEEQIEAAYMRKHESGAQCRAWAAKLIALVEAYHSVVTDERAYNLTFDFSPMPPAEGQPPSRAYGLYKWSVTNTLNKVGRRLARSIKTGNMDADKYRIPRPWLEAAKRESQLDANALISDFS